MNRATFVELRNLLAELYPDLSSIQRILHDAGIDQVRVELNTKVIDTWHFILREAEKLDQTARLLEVVKQEYGTILNSI